MFQDFTAHKREINRSIVLVALCHLFSAVLPIIGQFSFVKGEIKDEL